jgi:hypothetical protein
MLVKGRQEGIRHLALALLPSRCLQFWSALPTLPDAQKVRETQGTALPALLSR